MDHFGLLFLEETHAERKHKRDYGLKLGDFLMGKVCGPRPSRSYHDDPPGYRSTEASPLLVATDVESACLEKNQGFGRTFNRQVVLVIVGYAILA